ncbi:MAG TPA: UvrD-helicase domain-containing protein [Candidatus Hydrogenedentes bacterium]|nr:UvrD-helicase domain-containing protein [Candidatus Hydrogenedentota bacterium]
MSMDSPLLQGLNPEQRRAVCQTDGPVLVLAGAGSGKTRVITRRIAHVLARGLARPCEIAAVTFTNKAAEEMRERVGALVGKERAAEIAISTFHSFCVRVLREHIAHLGYRRDFTISTESDARVLMRRVLEDLDGSTKQRFDADLLLGAIGSLKNAARNIEDAAPSVADAGKSAHYREWFGEVYDRYQSALRAANSVDFDDLLALTLRLWRTHPGVLRQCQDRFRYIMVDEFQDTNRVQLELVKALGGKHRNVCVVGDDDQSIYGWRGAEPRNILDFEREFPGATVVALEQNYRSTETILNAANAVIAHNAARHPKRLWSALGKGRAIDWVVTGDDDHEAQTVVQWLEMVRRKTGAAYKDFAVLYRSNTQSRPIEIALRQASIPYVVVGGQDFFERSEIKDVVSYLKALANPRDEASFLRIVNVPRRGIGDATLHRIHYLCREESLPFVKGVGEALRRGLVSAEARHGIQELLSALRDHRDRLRAGKEPLSVIVESLLERIAYRKELQRTSKTDEQAFVRWNNVEAALDAIAEFAGKNAGASLGAFLDQSALAGGDDRFSKKERRSSGVTLMTVHSAKGLEFPFVFVVGAEEGLMPHEKCLGPEGIEEERRLFYVALTRGQRHVTLFEALSRGRHGRTHRTKTSRFVLEIPSEWLQRREMAASDAAPDCPDSPPAPDPPRRSGKTSRGQKGRA